MPKVSVCVPVYGVEKYIERCARSLFEQTITDGIEFIFVNDCTKDRSIEILESVLSEYPQREKQVKIIHRAQNGGLVAARNTGLQYATGDYIVHCDSDDWVDISMYERMYNAAIASNADVVICSYVDEYIGKVTRKFRINPQCSVKSYVDKNYGGLVSTLWNKLFKKDIALNETIYAPEHIIMMEDALRCGQMLTKCKKIAFTPNIYYHHEVNFSSLSHNFSIKHWNNCIEVIEKITELSKNNVLKKQIVHLQRVCLFQGLLNINNPELSKNSLQYWKKQTWNFKFSFLLDKNFSMKSKILVMVYGINSEIFTYVLRMLNKKV